MCHSGGASIPGSKPITADHLMKLRPDVCGHVNGGPTALTDEGVERVVRESQGLLQIPRLDHLQPHVADGAVISKLWGGAVQDIPVQGDYDGDHKTDTAVYRDGTWWILRSSDGAVISKLWGGAVQDIPFNSFFW